MIFFTDTFIQHNRKITVFKNLILLITIFVHSIHFSLIKLRKLPSLRNTRLAVAQCDIYVSL